MNNVENKIKELFIASAGPQVLGMEIGVNEELTLNYGMNSLSFIKFAVSIESEFGIEFGDEDLDFNKFRNLKSVISFVENRLNES